MPDDLTTEVTPQVEQLDKDAEYVTGEGKTLAAYIAEQKAKKADPAEKTTADGMSQEAEPTTTTADDKTAAEGTSQDSDTTAADEKTADVTSQESVQEITVERVKEILGDSASLDDVQSWRKAFDNREKWNASLTQKANSLAFLNDLPPEKWDILAPKLLPYIHGKETIPDTPEQFVDDAIKGLNGEIPESIEVKFHDDDYEEDRTMTIDKAHYEPVIKKVAQALFKKALPELPVLRERTQQMEKELEQSSQTIAELTRVNGYLVLESFFDTHPEHAPDSVNDKENPVDALFRVGSAGVDHPDYGKYLKFEAAAELSKKKNIPFKESWDTLYGTAERKIRRSEEVKSKVIENQKKESGEKGGEAAKPDPLERQKKRLPITYADSVERMFD